jgi:hypothetical protein
LFVFSGIFTGQKQRLSFLVNIFPAFSIQTFLVKGLIVDTCTHAFRYYQKYDRLSPRSPRKLPLSTVAVTELVLVGYHQQSQLLIKILEMKK